MKAEIIREGLFLWVVLYTIHGEDLNARKFRSKKKAESFKQEKENQRND